MNALLVEKLIRKHLQSLRLPNTIYILHRPALNLSISRRETNASGEYLQLMGKKLLVSSIYKTLEFIKTSLISIIQQKMCDVCGIILCDW